MSRSMGVIRRRFGRLTAATVQCMPALISCRHRKSQGFLFRKARHTLLTALFSGGDTEPPKLIVAILGRPPFLRWVATQSRPEILFERVGEPQDNDGKATPYISEIAPELCARLE